MRVALVHDDLVQWGGAERVLQTLSEIFPDAPIYTSLFDPKNEMLLKAFGTKNIHTSFLQKLPFSKYLYKFFFLFYPLAFEQFDFSDSDLVISQTTRFAKAIITKPHTKHVCLCHTPPRFLWNFSGEQPPAIAKLFLSLLRILDQITARRVDKFLAGSENAQKRIERIYRRGSEVCLPFVEAERFQGVESFEGGYYLVVSRLVKYKKVDVVIGCFNSLEERLIVVGDGPEFNNLSRLAGNNVELLGKVSENLLLNLLAGCKGLIVMAEEDFGLSALEAQVVGKGVIAFGEGGNKETVIDGITGTFFYKQTINDLKEAILNFSKLQINRENCINNSQRFSKDRFKKRLLEVLS